MPFARTAILCALLCTPLLAQQPYFTDDSDTVERHQWHVELINQPSWLQRTSLPATRQNTTVLHINYGLTSKLELGIDGPLIFLYQQQTPVTVGQGDTNFTFKLRLHSEHTDSVMPAITLACAIEIPTGNTRKQLGSGLADYGCNSVA
ncbi:MAG: hypothetical protein ABI995_08865, partial [Acidobacteriota bacterium]